VTQQPQTILLRGGLNIVTPAIAVPPGMGIAGSNYESDVRGYRRTGGYERYDGRDRPSDEAYWYLEFDAGSAAITSGQTVTGATSGATGVALQDAVVSSGSYGGGDAAGYLVLWNVVGTFQDDENLQVAAVTKSVANGTADEGAAPTDTLDKAFTKLAADAQRALISGVPGSGPVRMTAVLNGALYAIRDNAGATAGVLHKATAAGWSAQSLGNYLKFDAGSAEFFEGETATGGTSGATGTIRRVVLLAGAWGDSDAAGFLVLSGVAGTFQNNEAITSALGSATVDGTLTANALPAGGHYDWSVHNFYGAGFTPRLYAAGGVGRAFEWDGTWFALCFTGLSDALDKPTRVAQFAEHLFLFFDNGYYVNSEIGTPTQFQTTLGAGDGNAGHSFNDVLEATSTSLILLCESKVGFITGKDVDTFERDWISEEAGSEAWTGQVVGNPLYLDDAGVRRLSTTQAFGNWRMGTVTQAIEPVFRLKQDQGVNPVASVRVRAKDIYKVFFDDMTAIAVYFGRKDPECTVLEYAHEFFSAGVGTLTGERNESIFVGAAEDGYVFELERGRSFDGEAITAFMRLAFNSVGSPSHNKAWHKVTLECDVQPSAVLSISCDFGYGSPDLTPAAEAFSLAAGGGFWDESNWDEFYWDQQVVGQAEAYPNGFGQNMSAVIISEEIDDELPHNLSSITINYSVRGLRR
jgi:hypothetical protein